MKAGDVVRLVGIPPNLPDDDLKTRTIFEKCLGQVFLIAGMKSIDGLPNPLVELEVGAVVGDEYWKHTIWIEPEYVQLIEPYRVIAVLDRECGQRLYQLNARGPVWVVDTPTNHPVVENIWASYTYPDHLLGITTFCAEIGSSLDDVLLGILEQIYLHHGIYSANPPYTIMEVIGTEVNDKLRSALSRFGFDKFEATSEGFNATRPLPDGWSPDRWR